MDLITTDVLQQFSKKAIIHLTHKLHSILRLPYFPLQWKNLSSHLKTRHKNIKLLPYKTLLMPPFGHAASNYGMPTKNLIRIQFKPSNPLRIMTNTPICVSNHTFRTDLKINKTEKTADIRYKRFHSRLTNQRKPLISSLSSNFTPGNSFRRLKRKH